MMEKTRDEEKREYQQSHYRIKLLTELLGATPKNQNLVKGFVSTKFPPNKKVFDETKGEIVVAQQEDEDMDMLHLEEKSWTGFRKDENGLFLYEYVIKGFLKNAGNVLKDIVGVKALRSKIDDYIFVSPRRIYLNQQEPDGVEERPIRVMTPTGQRVALIKSDYIKAGKILDFSIILVKHKEITWPIINRLMEYGQLMGLSQFRNGGYGRFVYKCDEPKEWSIQCVFDEA